MRLVGPNSQGLVNFASGTVASFSTMFLEAPPEDGPVAIISQSGATSAVVYGCCARAASACAIATPPATMPMSASPSSPAR